MDEAQTGESRDWQERAHEKEMNQPVFGPKLNAVQRLFLKNKKKKKSINPMLLSLIHTFCFFEGFGIFSGLSGLTSKAQPRQAFLVSCLLFL